MAIIKWEPFSELNRFFDDFPISSFKNLGWDLAVDVYEEEGNVVAKMNIPGVDPNKLDVSIEDNLLRVSGSHEEEKEKKNKHYYSKEIRSGAFERVISLPGPVQKDKISAEYEQGVLKITVPKAKNGEFSHKVEIKVKK